MLSSFELCCGACVQSVHEDLPVRKRVKAGDGQEEERAQADAMDSEPEGSDVSYDSDGGPEPLPEVESEEGMHTIIKPAIHLAFSLCMFTMCRLPCVAVLIAVAADPPGSVLGPRLNREK